MPLRDVALPAGVPAARHPQRELIRGVVAGEPWADEALYDTLYPIVAGALQKILHRPSDYEDLVQTSFELIVRSLHRPRAVEVENLAAWASTIAARVAVDALRGRVRERSMFHRDAATVHALEDIPGPELEQQIHVRQELEWLQGELVDMNPQQVEVMLLHDVLGFELSEIARVTHTSAPATQKRLSRAHLELRRRAQKRVNGSRG
jgi:RNA polymerase sigma-70 factor (ECF subfamily)